MAWEDIAIAFANILFSYSLVYQVWFGFKKRKGFLTVQTSLLTTVGLYIMGVAFFTLQLYLSTITVAFSGTMWLVLLLQSLFYRKA